MDRPSHEVYTHSHQPVVLASHGSRTAEEAAGFGHRIMKRVTGETFDTGLSQVAVTISVGIAQITGEDGVKPDDLILFVNDSTGFFSIAVGEYHARCKWDAMRLQLFLCKACW